MTKKIISLLLAIFIILIVGAISATAETTYSYGDVNGDGQIDIRDVTLLQKYYCCLVDIDKDSAKRADVNRDGISNMIDATIIQKYIMAVVKSLPNDGIKPTEPTTESVTETQPTTALEFDNSKDNEGYNDWVIKP
jgi:hypothetical protein